MAGEAVKKAHEEGPPQQPLPPLYGQVSPGLWEQRCPPCQDRASQPDGTATQAHRHSGPSACAQPPRWPTPGSDSGVSASCPGQALRSTGFGALGTLEFTSWGDACCEVRELGAVS